MAFYRRQWSRNITGSELIYGNTKPLCAKTNHPCFVCTENGRISKDEELGLEDRDWVKCFSYKLSM